MTNEYQEILDEAIGPITVNECIRLYNFKGEHKISILACGVDMTTNKINYDIAAPDGKVLMCGVDHDVVETLKENIGFAALPD